MKVVVDNKIPYISEAIERIADEVVYAPGQKIDAGMVKDADALIVRTRTQCNKLLLEGSRVRFIATATIGYDHIDTEYCSQAGIYWTNAPGCNSASVAQYVHSALLLLQREKGLKLEGLTLGVIGVGNVGSKVVKVGESLGMRVLKNDLPRAELEGPEAYVSLQRLAEECDVLTFHVPLYIKGVYKTFHLADAAFLQSLKRKPVIINTSRGEVVETEALLEALECGMVSDAIIDVWENEPNINSSLLQHAFIATPHIAGYSADGKANATRMALDALCSFFHVEATYEIAPPMPAETTIHASSLAEAHLQIYNPMVDSCALKSMSSSFENLRGNYPLRREALAYHIELD